LVSLFAYKIFLTLWIYYQIYVALTITIPGVKLSWNLYLRNQPFGSARSKDFQQVNSSITVFSPTWVVISSHFYSMISPISSQILINSRCNRGFIFPCTNFVLLNKRMRPSLSGSSAKEVLLDPSLDHKSSGIWSTFFLPSHFSLVVLDVYNWVKSEEKGRPFPYFQFFPSNYFLFRSVLHILINWGCK